MNSLVALFSSLFLARAVVMPKPRVIPTPIPPKKYSYITHGNRNLPKIALTFDADMTPGMIGELKSGKIKSWYNQKIVDILESRHIPATIFIAGLWAETYPQITTDLSKNPLFEIANHSYSHPRFTPACFALPPLPSWGAKGEFSKSQAALEKATGSAPKYFRFPGGCQTDSDIKLANSYGLTVVGWDDASGDSFNTNRAAIVNSVKTKTQNGSIILFHFHGNKNAPLTADVLPELIDYLQKKGFQFVKLSDLVAAI